MFDKNSRNMNTSEGYWLFIFLIALQKLDHVDCKFLVTPKSSVSFNLKHIFANLTRFMHVD